MSNRKLADPVRRSKFGERAPSLFQPCCLLHAPSFAPFNASLDPVNAFKESTNAIPPSILLSLLTASPLCTFHPVAIRCNEFIRRPFESKGWVSLRKVSDGICILVQGNEIILKFKFGKSIEYKVGLGGEKIHIGGETFLFSWKASGREGSSSGFVASLHLMRLH